MKWNLVADSSCDLKSAQLSKEVLRTVVPMKLLLGDAEWVDDASLDAKKFMQAMKHCKGAVKSACPAPGEFLDAFRAADRVICICITSKLSGTYNSAMQAKRLAQEEAPEKEIFVLDSLATGGKMQLLLQKAQELIEADLSFSEICDRLTAYRDETELLFSLAAFGNLIKNGRMPRLKGTLATVPGIRPIARAKGGEIDILEKPRGERAALLCLVEQMKKKKPQGIERMVITHCQNEKAAQALESLIKTVWQNCQVQILPTGGLCSLYADDQGLLIAF